jgi:metallo-beta-lactamase class B
MKHPWEGYLKPFKMAGNLYFVGTVPASSHIVDTGEGLILFDSGFPQSLYLVTEGIREVGFRPSDIKYIVHSHGHYDHIGGTKALTRLTGAKTFIGERDLDYVTGKLDLTWARELGCEYHEAFEPDFIMGDGDVITLGNTTVNVVATPGHTPGTMSFFFDIYEGDKVYRAGTFGGAGMNSLKAEFLNQYGLSFDCREAFKQSIRRLRQEKVDVFFGNHVGGNDTVGKYNRMSTEPANPFINSSEWQFYLDKCEAQLNKLLTSEGGDNR